MAIPMRSTTAGSSPSRRALVAAGLLALVAGACGQHGAPTKSVERKAAERTNWPAGTVLVLNDAPITADEVDAVASWFARFEPQNSLAHCRRLALTNAVLPLVAARGIDPARREAARALAAEYERALREGTLPSGPLAGPMETEREGGAKQIGLDAWAAVVDAQIGAWSSVYETPGAFEIVRLKARDSKTAALAETFKVGVLQFPYVDEEDGFARMNAALDASKLVFVDPAWKDYVPTLWQHRLHVESP